MATEININDLLEANEAQQKALREQREKERQQQEAAARGKELSAARQKKIDNAQKEISYLEFNINKLLEGINKLQGQSLTAGGKKVNEEIQKLKTLVDKYNTTVREFNKTAPVERTPAMGGIPGAGRERVVSTPADTKATSTGTFTPEITIRGGKQDTTAKVAEDTGAGAGGVTAGAGATGGKKTKTTVNKDQLGQQAVAQAGITVGINQAVIQYMKENYPEDWQQIKKLRDLAKQDGDISTAELGRIADAFKTTTYWKNAAREKNRTTIGAYMISNGLDTISNAALIDKLTEDVYVTGVLTELEAKAQIRKEAVTKLGLTGPGADPSKIKIAQAMIDGGQSFVTAAADYVKFYTETTDTPLNEFDPFEDDSFLSAFRESKSFTDFLQKVKTTPTYSMSNKGRQEINGIKLRLQGLTRGLGLGYSPQQLEQQAVNIASGKETFEQLEFSLRSIAGEAFPAFKDRILAGETMESIARPYVSSMTRILELPDSSIDISDPNSDVRKALIGDGKTPKPLWQFEQDLFKDARWQYTSNARDTIDRVSMDILKRFGVMG